ncbi:MAG: TetR/AcrR family transcriptional regulator [Paracoccaceae bacterium]
MKTSSRPLPTKDRLIRSAANLFRTRGYHGVGLNDLLADANAPKGSLYHHFPQGKSDLALAAATWASDEMLRLIAASFDDAATFRDGATTLCFKLAKLFDLTGKWDACPIGSTLFEGPDNEGFRTHAMHLYDGWIAEVYDHAGRFGMSETDGQRAAEHLFVLVQGGWLLARARRSSDVIRELPAMIAD